MPIPPFPALLTHNHPPSNFEEQSIKQILSSVHQKISRIDVELARLQAVKETLQRFREQQERIVSLVRRIPHEIICEIMKQSWAGYNREEPAQAQKVAVILASVCSYWRAVALSTSELWTMLVYKHTNQCLLLTQLMLSRSGDRKLQLHICAYPSGNAKTFPLLHTINHDLDRIHHLSLGEFRILGAFTPPFQCLRTIKFTFDMAVYDLFQFLLNCPVLEDAEVLTWTNIEGSFGEASTHDMPKLRRLSITYDGNPSALFEHITTPNLVELRTVMSGAEFWPPGNVTDFLRRSNFSLKKLDLDYTGSNPVEMFQLLNTVPHLEELSINEQGETTKATYEYLTVRGVKHPVHLPNLTKLVVYSDPKYTHPDSLHAMLVSRSADFPLSHVEIILSRNLSNPGKARFKCLIQDADRLGYILGFRDDHNNVLNIAAID